CRHGPGPPALTLSSPHATCREWNALVGKPGRAEMTRERVTAERVPIRMGAAESLHAECGLLLEEGLCDGPRLVDVPVANETHSEDPEGRRIPRIRGDRLA